MLAAGRQAAAGAPPRVCQTVALQPAAAGQGLTHGRPAEGGLAAGRQGPGGPGMTASSTPRAWRTRLWRPGACTRRSLGCSVRWPLAQAAPGALPAAAERAGGKPRGAVCPRGRSHRLVRPPSDPAQPGWSACHPLPRRPQAGTHLPRGCRLTQQHNAAAQQLQEAACWPQLRQQQEPLASSLQEQADLQARVSEQAVALRKAALETDAGRAALEGTREEASALLHRPSRAPTSPALAVGCCGHVRPGLLQARTVLSRPLGAA